ncbi:MAG: hypothetical protein VXZ82_04540 [Planctomycetota bacterium]|nr:hypothetical protein [Planctomycetota bacterium]
MRLESTQTIRHQEHVGTTASTQPKLRRDSSPEQGSASVVDTYKAAVDAKLGFIREDLVVQAKLKIQAGDYLKEQTALEVASAILQK